MKIFADSCVRQVPKPGLAIVVLLLGYAPVYAQGYEITPLIGGTFGGTVNLEEQGIPNFQAHLQDRLSFGISGGIRFDGDDCRKCNFIEFRWLRQDTHLVVQQDPLVAVPAAAPLFRPAVTLDHFLADFTHEWSLKDIREGLIRPFLTATLGAVRVSTPDASTTRFVFGLSTGVNVFPKPHFGIHFQVEYLPIVMHADLQRVVCVGGCIVLLDGGLLNQFNISVGPSFRFSPSRVGLGTGDAPKPETGGELSIRMAACWWGAAGDKRTDTSLSVAGLRSVN